MYDRRVSTTIALDRHTSDWTDMNSPGSREAQLDGTDVPDDISLPQTPVDGGSDKLSCETPSSRCGAFQCSQCIRTIDVGRPIYMRNDFAYCSKDCRELGVSSMHRIFLQSSANQNSSLVSRLLQRLGGSVASISSVDSSESFEAEDSNVTRITALAQTRARSLLQKLVGSVSSTSLGSSLVRTYSTGLLWGRDVTRNTSFNMLFAYLPDFNGAGGVYSRTGGPSLQKNNSSPTSHGSRDYSDSAHNASNPASVVSICYASSEHSDR